MFRAQAIVQNASFGYPRTPMFETGARKTWLPREVHWSEDRTYAREATARGMVTRWFNESASATTGDLLDDFTDEHGFRVRVYRIRHGQTVMVRTRVLPVPQRHVVRVHEPYMPGQGPRSRHAEHVFPSAEEAHAWAHAARERETDGRTFTVHPITVTP